MSKPLRIALTKGRLENKCIELFEKMGLDCSIVRDKGRRLILPVGDSIEVVLAKAADVITYVERGVCDLGVVGKDTILEYGRSFYEVMDLGFGRCRFALAGPAGKDFYAGYAGKQHLLFLAYPEDILKGPGLVYLIWHFGDDDKLFAVLLLFYFGLCANGYLAPAGLICCADL